MASAILTAGAPQRMSVYDERAVSALALLGYPSPRGYFSRYMATVYTLACEVNSARNLGWYPRDVDQALFALGAGESS